MAVNLDMQAVEALEKAPEDNIILAGDMNWNDAKDGTAQLPQGWWAIDLVHPAVSCMFCPSASTPCGSHEHAPPSTRA